MMQRIQLIAVASVAVSLFPPAARGEGTFTFSVAPNGTSFQMAKAGETVSFSCFTLLEHAGAGGGAGGWSFGVAVEGATVTSATTGGTNASEFLDPAGSIERAHIIDPAENGGVAGVVSSVVLSTAGLETSVLPAERAWSILSLTVDATVPAGGGTARFEPRDGLVAAGESFPLSVTQDGAPVAPAVQPPLVVALQDTNDCCDNALSVGFSRAVIKDGPIFEGIAGIGEGCFAGGGEIIAEAPLGAMNSTTVHVNIISNLPERNVQGWQLGVAVDGAAVIDSITTAGTAADLIPNGGYRDPEESLAKSTIIDPAKNGGQKGAVTSIALTVGGLAAAQLPTAGTQSILKIELSAAEPQGEADQTATLRFDNGLIVSAAPVPLVVTVWGQQAAICNADRAGVTVVFRKTAGTTFRRGDANDDDGVNIADAIWILNALFSGGDQPPCADAGDANDDGIVNISDPVHLVNYLFVGAQFPPPPSPGPAACGLDPTGDELECLASSCP